VFRCLVTWTLHTAFGHSVLATGLLHT
jgi:hypothetical protein